MRCIVLVLDVGTGRNPNEKEDAFFFISSSLERRVHHVVAHASLCPARVTLYCHLVMGCHFKQSARKNLYFFEQQLAK